MWNPASPTRRALGFLMGAAIAFLGSAMLLKAGRSLPQVTGGAGAGEPGTLLFAVVIVLLGLGVLLAGMAGKEFLDQRRRSHRSA